MTVLCTQLPAGVQAVESEISPIALLRGVENARLGTSAGRIRCRVVESMPPGDPRTSVVTLEFQEARRRISTVTVMPIVDRTVPSEPAREQEVTRRCVFDGDALYEYDGVGNAVRVPPAQAPPDWAFDPRILGITVLYRPEVSIAQCVAYAGAKESEFIGREEMDDSAVAHVALVDQYDQRVQYWIEPSGTFRVRRVQLEVAGFTYTSASRFEKALPMAWLPTEIETIYRGPDGQIRQQWKIDEIEAETNVTFEPGLFSIAGLKMARGTPVADLARKERIGYWDGERLNADPSGPAAEMKPLTPVESGRGRVLIVSNIVAIVLVVGAIAWRIWRRRTMR